MRPSIFLLVAIILISFSYCEAYPTSFSWDSKDGANYVFPALNQNNPAYCNAGWAFAAVGVLNSRIKILRKAATPDITLSVQSLLECDAYDYGCLGGEPISAFRWVKRNTLTDSSCRSYLATGYTNGSPCSSLSLCQSCHNGQCSATMRSKIYTINDFGIIGGEADMIDEISRWGPIACGVAASAQFRNYSAGIINDTSQPNKIDHYVMIYGWGETNGTKFWKFMNSWGPTWGEAGSGRILRGKNTLSIESNCAWGGPRDTWTNDTRNQTYPASSVSSEVKLSESYNDYGYTLPSYLTPQHSSLTPGSCNTSWAFALFHTLSDRYSIKTKGMSTISISVQALLNCGVGHCEKGGAIFDALLFMQKYGITQESCQTYNATSPAHSASCAAKDNCASCTGTPFKFMCIESKNYKRYKVTNITSVVGVSLMKDEIKLNGPILCAIYESQSFRNYRGGIFKEQTIYPHPNHQIEVVSFGSEGGVDYWIGRSSYGTAWGQSGFFRIVVSDNNLGIEKQCYKADLM